jgi:hypothetical protein
MILVGIEIKLWAKRLKHLPINIYENYFALIIHESHDCCSSFIDSFLSPRIFRFQTNDATLGEFYIEINHPTHSCESILNVCYGSDFRVSENVSFFNQFKQDLTLFAYF